jgi:hypothetical protein
MFDSRLLCSLATDLPHTILGSLFLIAIYHDLLFRYYYDLIKFVLMPTFHLLPFLAAVDFELGPRSLNQRQGHLGRLPLRQFHDLDRVGVNFVLEEIVLLAKVGSLPCDVLRKVVKAGTAPLL